MIINNLFIHHTLVVCVLLSYRNSAEAARAAAELVMGHFFKTQPNPKFLDPTQPNLQKSSPDPTQPIIDTWNGILGYTENFIQQLLHDVSRHMCRRWHAQSTLTLFLDAATILDPRSVVTGVSSVGRLYSSRMLFTTVDMLSPVWAVVPKWRTARTVWWTMKPVSQNKVSSQKSIRGMDYSIAKVCRGIVVCEIKYPAG